MSLVRFYCAVHGYLCEAPAGATVTCGERLPARGAVFGRRCGKRATTVKQPTQDPTR